MDAREDGAAPPPPPPPATTGSYARSPPIYGLSGASGSGIDWSIFRDGEDETFAWLWRTNATMPNTLPASAVGLPTNDLATDVQEFLASESGASSSLTAAMLDSHTTASGIPRPALSSQASIASSMQDYDDDDDDDEDDDAFMSSGDQAVAMSADGSSAGKRQAKRRKKPSTVEDEAKKQQRRVKNLASVREFRKRKMRKMEENEVRLCRLEAENMDLKMRLKIGKDALQSEQREKQEIKDQMREMLQRGASEQEVAQFVNMYKVTYSDYGPKRREKLQFHLARIKELLLPTQVTKLCLYSVEQGSEMIARDQDMTEDSSSVTDAGMAPMSLWGILANELNVAPAQQRQLLERRESIKKIRDDLNHTMGIVKKLEEVTDYKNTALESQIQELQHILTPSQATKFIIWVKENPAFMYMLDKLVDSTLRGTEDGDT